MKIRYQKAMAADRIDTKEEAIAADQEYLRATRGFAAEATGIKAWTIFAETLTAWDQCHNRDFFADQTGWPPVPTWVNGSPDRASDESIRQAAIASALGTATLEEAKQILAEAESLAAVPCVVASVLAQK